MKTNKVSEFYSEDKSKRAVVVEHNGKYSIDFYEDNNYNHSILYVDESLRLVEDVAENYATGIFRNIKDFK